MDIERIDLNLLVVFSTIFSEGGITPAGKKLHLSQSAVSHSLSRLREVFDDPLFVRSGQMMQPTPTARNLYQRIQPLLTNLKQTLNDFSLFDPVRAERSFTIGVREQVESVVLPAIMAGLLEVAPLIRISTVRLDRGNLEADLKSGAFDVAVDVLQPLSGSLRHTALTDDELVVVARKGHPVLAQSASLDLDTFLALEHVQVSGRRAGRGIEDIELNRLGHERNIRLRCQNISAALAVVANSDLVVSAGYAYAREAVRDAKLVVLPFPIAAPSLSLFLYWHQNVDSDPASLWFRDFFARAFQRKIGDTIVAG
jgi:DNA-binding transcriptional LysR family regulator